MESITGDVWGVLDTRAAEAGLANRAELIQVARAYLIVEGAHDEAVIRHFYREQLERQRIVVLPARGAKKATSLIEADLLAMLDRPIIIMFDDIRAAELVGDVALTEAELTADHLRVGTDTLRDRQQPHANRVERVLVD